MEKKDENVSHLSRDERLELWKEQWCEKWDGEVASEIPYVLESRSNPGFCINLEQYDDLRFGEGTQKTSQRISQWNLRREAAPEEIILLAGADLRGVNLMRADLRDADLVYADMRGARLSRMLLADADLSFARLEGTRLLYSDITRTRFWGIHIDTATDFTGCHLETAFIHPSLQSGLEYNIRRIGWTVWEKNCPRHKRPFRYVTCRFWWISDYGISTQRVVAIFAGIAFFFAILYWLCPWMLTGTISEDQKPTLLAFIHDCYFSVVTMTTLGFGDIHANPKSWLGQLVLVMQVVLGYVLLGALVTRLGIVFTGSGPVERPPLAPSDQQWDGGDYFMRIIMPVTLFIAGVVMVWFRLGQ